MTRRTIVIGVVLGCVGVPPALFVISAAAHHSANRITGTMISSGAAREYIVHVPDGLDRSKPAPLVISLHGAGTWPAVQMHVSRWNDAADRHGFIVVYPSGEGFGPRVFFLRERQTPSRMPDIVFISELIDRLQASYNIDPARIFANGLSNGGGMAFALACTLPRRIAAVGAVGAALTVPADWCPDPRPVPMIAFHGTADRITPYHGGKTWVAADTFPGIPGWTANWARRNRCAPAPVESAVAADVTRLEYVDCAENAVVALYAIMGGGHTWPGGTELPEWFAGRTSRSIDATEVMWAFFREHPLVRE